MLKLQGTIKAMKVSVGQNGISRQVTFDIGGDSVLDDLQEIMRSKAKLNITLENQQMMIGDPLVVTHADIARAEKRQGATV